LPRSALALLDGRPQPRVAPGAGASALEPGSAGRPSTSLRAPRTWSRGGNAPRGRSVSRSRQRAGAIRAGLTATRCARERHPKPAAGLGAPPKGRRARRVPDSLHGLLRTARSLPRPPLAVIPIRGFLCARMPACAGATRCARRGAVSQSADSEVCRSGGATRNAPRRAVPNARVTLDRGLSATLRTCCTR